MEEKRKKTDVYEGFEQGPIRPPSEARSLLVRLTRNCPWNHCTFCRVYKKRKFSLRSVDHIIKDIDFLHGYIERIRQIIKPGGFMDNEVIDTLYGSFQEKDRVAFNAAMNWYAEGMKSVFLQDANSLIMKPDDLVRVLSHLKTCFPNVERITSYARSHTIARIPQEDLNRIARAGLNREARNKMNEALRAPRLDQNQCLDLLSLHLKGMHRLRMGTLDSFFLHLAQSVCLELGLPPKWRIADEIVLDKLRQEAVQELFEAQDTADTLEVESINKWVGHIRPDCVQLNTVTRPPAASFAATVSRDKLEDFAGLFEPKAEVIADYRGVHAQSEFVATRDTVLQLLERRPCSLDDVADGLGIHRNEALKHVEELLATKRIENVRTASRIFYRASDSSASGKGGPS